MPLLESLPVNRQNAADQAAHFPVQRVARQDGSSSDDFRGYQGRLEAGRLKVGDEVKVLPSGHVAKVAEIYNANGKTESVEAGEVLTVVLDTDIDISRGNSIVSADSAIVPEQQFQAALCWFDDIPLNLRRKYLLKHTTQTHAGKNQRNCLRLGREHSQPGRIRRNAQAQRYWQCQL